ncbi:MAG TPA: FhaA domain-containing protein, partial [Blastocatellia bacterium]|nr:FhaA domain-containing protein [Blastocatellia bacterium]
MADNDPNIFDRAEAIARRVLGRLGAKADKAALSDQQTLSPREVGALTSRIEEVIEKSLVEDSRGVRRVAPNHFEILLTYETSSRLNRQYTQALADELKASIYEYITNRRYETRGPIEVKTGQDLFAQSPVIKADFRTETTTGGA